eukprot:scaffold1490_cov395-Pavlova_lutheri.AAC.2
MARVPSRRRRRASGADVHTPAPARLMRGRRRSSTECTRTARVWALLSYGSTKGRTYGSRDYDTGDLSAQARGLRSLKEFSTRPRTRKRNAHGYGGERAPNVIVPDCPIHRTMSWGFTHLVLCL